jgi:hypothetical protein
MPWEVHIEWCRALEEEFFKQGSLELGSNRPASPLMDPSKPGVTEPVNAVAFFNVSALPLIQTWEVIFHNSGHRLLARATRNLQKWQSSIPNSRESRRHIIITEQKNSFPPPPPTAGRKSKSVDMGAWISPASALIMNNARRAA